jgi:hypothetical protein
MSDKTINVKASINNGVFTSVREPHHSTFLNVKGRDGLGKSTIWVLWFWTLLLNLWEFANYAAISAALRVRDKLKRER